MVIFFILDNSFVDVFRWLNIFQYSNLWAEQTPLMDTNNYSLLYYKC